VSTWKSGKKTQVVQSYSRKDASDTFAWHARISKHPAEELSFDDLWGALSDDHYNKEAQYIGALKRAEKLNDTDLGEVWALHYTFPPPVSPRVFTQLLFKHLDVDESNPSQKRTGYIIQLPFDVEDEEVKQGKRVVKGKYVSVERFRELESEEGEDGRGGYVVEWRMATCSTPGGLIPTWISERSIPSEIMKDVPALITWIKKQKTA